MITTQTRADGNRAFRIALVASLLVHVLLAVLAVLANDGLRRIATKDLAHRVRRPPDEVITISSALHLEKHARPVPVPPRRRAARPAPPGRAVLPVARPARRPQRALEPPPAVALAKPAYQAPSLLRHELAKLAPHAATQPERSQKATTVRPRARPQQLAAVEHTRGNDPNRALAAQAALSQERLAQIERDLAKAIAQTRTQVDPIRNVPREPPAAPKHYRIQLQGKFGNLRRGEGTYSPIKSWRENGLDYYYVSYEFTYPDGTYETGSVPWPIHFNPSADPFVREDIGLLAHTPLPAPPPDYVPPGTLGKALRSYFPSLRFSDRN